MKEEPLVDADSAGYWDLHISLAVRFNWLPWQVNSLPEGFLEELLAYIKAESEYHVWEEKRRQAEQKANEKARQRGAGGVGVKDGPAMLPPNLPKRSVK